jgi:hypothetical protein
MSSRSLEECEDRFEVASWVPAYAGQRRREVMPKVEALRSKLRREVQDLRIVAMTAFLRCATPEGCVEARERANKGLKIVVRDRALEALQRQTLTFFEVFAVSARRNVRL